MGRIPRWLRLAVARGMNKGNSSCSFISRSARFSQASDNLNLKASRRDRAVTPARGPSHGRGAGLETRTRKKDGGLGVCVCACGRTIIIELADSNYRRDFFKSAWLPSQRCSELELSPSQARLSHGHESESLAVTVAVTVTAHGPSHGST
jgi:hypothetical protein